MCPVSSFSSAIKLQILGNQGGRGDPSVLTMFLQLSIDEFTTIVSFQCVYPFLNLISIALSKSIIALMAWSLCIRLNVKPKLEQLSCITKLNLARDHRASGVIGPIRSV